MALYLLDINKNLPSPYGYICLNWGNVYCHFPLTVRDGRVVYMKQKLSAGAGTYIVIAERKRFLAAWSRQTKQEPQLTQGDENAWRKDYKFHEAEEGFSEGEANPVPLSEPTCRYILEGGLPAPVVSFTNGITRTIWLLANDVTLFPVLVYSLREAQLMQRGVGAFGHEPVSVKELYEKYAPKVLPRYREHT